MFSLQIEKFLHVNDFYGLKHPETLDSLILELLPSLGYTYKALEKDRDLHPSSPECIKYDLFQEILNTLRNSAGFHIPKVAI